MTPNYMSKEAWGLKIYNVILLNHTEHRYQAGRVRRDLVRSAIYDAIGYLRTNNINTFLLMSFSKKRKTQNVYSKRYFSKVSDNYVLFFFNDSLAGGIL